MAAKKPTPRKRPAAGREEIGPVPVLETEGLESEEPEISGLRGHADGVADLAEEGQAMEADYLSGLDQADAANADESEVTTREVPEDDVPPEYRERD